MLELLLGLAFSVGVWRAARARHQIAIACGVLLGYLLLADLLAAWAVSKPHQVLDVFSYLFLGPLALPERAAGVLPLPAFALAHPLATRLARIAIAATASWRCLHESSQLNPLLPRAYTLDGIGLPFAGAAVLDAIEGVLQLWALEMAARTF